MIPFTQYLLPDGERRETGLHASPEIEAKARDVLSWGGRFECEVLRTGEVSLTCEADDEDGEVNVLAMEIVPNGPEVPVAVERLVTEAWKQSRWTAKDDDNEPDDDGPYGAGSACSPACGWCGMCS